MRESKNIACLICDFVIRKDDKPYCTIRQEFTEKLPPIRCEADCPQRHTFVDDLPELHSLQDISNILRSSL